MNTIKHSGGSESALALQVTKPARAAGLVEENSEGDATYLADVRVHAFDSLLLVVDVGEVEDEHEAALVAAAAKDTGSAYRTSDATVSIAGHGYQVQLPPARDAGLDAGDPAPCEPAPGVLTVTTGDKAELRVAQDLRTIRREQAES